MYAMYAKFMKIGCDYTITVLLTVQVKSAKQGV